MYKQPKNLKCEFLKVIIYYCNKKYIYIYIYDIPWRKKANKSCMRPLGKKSITLLKDLKEEIYKLKDKAYTWIGGPTIVNMSMTL